MVVFTLRQFRTQAAVAIAVLVVAGTVVAVVGPQVLHAYKTGVANCGTYDDCATATALFVAKYAVLQRWLGVLVTVAPGLVGIFWGTPLVARELESGTFRLAWTQSVGRTRWLLVKLGLTGLISVALAGALSLMVTWWASPLDKVTMSPFSSFDSRDIVPLGYAAFAFALGVAAGVVVRRTLPAMAATLAVFAGVRLAIVSWLRPHFMAPLVLNAPYQFSGPGGAGEPLNTALTPTSWVLSNDLVNSAGEIVGTGGGPGLSDNLNINVTPAGVDLGTAGQCPNLHSAQQGIATANDLVQRCVDQLHLRSVITYQPASRYWTFQTEELLVFLGLALALGGFTVWWVRHRLA